jgi:hypothetical protein
LSAPSVTSLSWSTVSPVGCVNSCHHFATMVVRQGGAPVAAE